MKAKNSRELYFNFPVQLLSGALTNTLETMKNIAAYSVYKKVTTQYPDTNIQNFVEVANSFEVTFADPQVSFEIGRKLYESIDPKSPFTGIRCKMLFEFSMPGKTQKDIVILLAFLAIKSIVYKKKCIKTTNEMIFARMAGFVSTCSNDELPEPLKQFTTRFKFDGIKSALVQSYGVNFYARNTRGMFISFNNVCDLEELITFAETQRINSHEKARRKEIEDTRKRVLSQLKTAPTPAP